MAASDPSDRTPEGALNRVEAVPTYVGFCDVLGFGQRVLTDFDEALTTYNELIRVMRFDTLVKARPRLRMKMLSDAVVVTSPELADVVVAANLLQFAALASQNCLLRGGIGFGLHVEKATDGHLFVVSEPLVRAVVVEKKITHPCIALDVRILPSPGLWLPYRSNIERPLLHIDGRWIVNPLGLFWGTSAATRVAQLAVEFPEHSAKFDWFLDLHGKIFEAAPLIPTPDEWKALGGVIDEHGAPGMPPGSST